MKPESEKDCQISDFWVKLDLHVGLFFITNLPYFFHDWVLGEEMRSLVTFFLDGLKMFTGTKGVEWPKVRIAICKAKGSTHQAEQEVTFEKQITVSFIAIQIASNMYEVSCRT